MNLLLLLSALLSAITGAGVSGRAPQAVTEVASVAVRAAAVTQARAVTRPVAVLPTLHQIAVGSFVTGPAIAPTHPIYAGRRRE